MDQPLPQSFDRNAVITIQGGGIYGLSLLGQLYDLVYAVQVEPLALAGSSAGAILATLYWAGLTPREILDRFVNLAGSKGVNGPTALVDLFGPTVNNGHSPKVKQDYENFIKCADRLREGERAKLKSAFEDLATQIEELERHLTTPKQPEDPAQLKKWKITRFCSSVWNAPGNAVSSTRRLLNMRRSLLNARELYLKHSDLLADLKIVWEFLRRKGAFDGHQLEQIIDQWIRASTKLKNVDLPQNRLLRFRDITATGLYFPPLFLTATNVTYGRLELINSFEPQYQDLEIARAVRASAGFPVVFRPTCLNDNNGNRCLYVDGGVISNFPSWIFSRDFRQKMNLSEKYQPLAARPWMNVGLRLVDTDEPPATAESASDAPNPAPGTTTANPAPSADLGIWDYYIRLARFGTGIARDELENVLLANAPRPLLVRQDSRKSQAPKGDEMWHLHKIEEKTVYTMVYHAARITDEQFGNLQFHLPPDHEVQRLLKLLVDQAASLFGVAGDDQNTFRANVFIPSKKTLFLRYHFNMDKAPDLHTQFDFESGHTGRCYVRRRPSLGNLAEVFQKAQQNDQSLFDFYRTSQETYRIWLEMGDKAPSWLLSVPIFDPQEVFQLTENEVTSDATRPYYCEIPGRVDGAVFGVLNLDAVLDYDHHHLPNSPADQLPDPRIGATFALMQDVAFAIGNTLGRRFGVQSNSPVLSKDSSHDGRS